MWQRQAPPHLNIIAKQGYALLERYLEWKESPREETDKVSFRAYTKKPPVDGGLSVRLRGDTSQTL
jgi:hypothetical protein